MTLLHHPPEDVLLAHAAGTLGAGPALVVAVHIEGCAACRQLVRALEVAGGALLAQLPPAALSSLALERAMAAIELPRPIAKAASQHVAQGVDMTLPAALQGRRIGRWRWLAPGMRWCRIATPEDPRANVALMRGRAGALLPAHGHRGSEFTQVLAGVLLDADERFGAGEMLVADDSINHHLRVAPQADCLCITAIDGRMKMNGLIGRIVQPLVGP